MANLTKKQLLQMLKRHEYVRSHVASAVGVDEATIRRWVKKHDIDVQNEKNKHFGRVIQRDKTSKIKQRTTSKPMDGGNILIIGDTHEPFTHPDYFDHCRRVRDKYKCDTIVHIGDEVDNHALSYHEKADGAVSASTEYHQAYESLHTKWFKEFPVCYVCIGNHTSLMFRKAQTHGIPSLYLKSYQEIWQAPPGWVWDKSFEINGVRFVHGTGKSGKTAHELWAADNRQSTVIGHCHSHAGIKYLASYNSLIYGMNVGCGVDIDTYAMVYGEKYSKRPTLACGVVTENGKVGIIEPLEM